MLPHRGRIFSIYFLLAFKSGSTGDVTWQTHKLGLPNKYHTPSLSHPPTWWCPCAMHSPVAVNSWADEGSHGVGVLHKSSNPVSSKIWHIFLFRGVIEFVVLALLVPDGMVEVGTTSLLLYTGRHKNYILSGQHIHFLDWKSMDVIILGKRNLGALNLQK